MIIIGVDPGTIVTGYGVIETLVRSPKSEVRSRKTMTPDIGLRTPDFSIIDFGTIESKKISAMPKRLEQIFSQLQAAIQRTKPDEFAIETSFYGKNAQSAMKLGQARGVALVAAELAGLEIAEYAPRVIKRAVTGNGNADKSQVEFMVRKLLNLPEHDRKLADAYDALAIAITHAMRRGTGKKSSKSWEEFVKNNPERVK